jgi:hypothetical protein
MAAIVTAMEAREQSGQGLLVGIVQIKNIEIFL